jgi:threonine aldolase
MTMTRTPVDLRSDLLTRPTEQMIAAMTEAARGPATFGLREDADVQRLEARVATELGHEDALFCPTCTQANQIAIHLHCRPGDSLAAEAHSHVFTSEAGSLSALSGVMPVPVPGYRGIMELGELQAALNAGDALRSSVGLVLIENTHVRSGGCVVPLAAMNEQRAAARAAEVPVHIDGARLPNAALALGTSMAELGAMADSVSLSLNKGLGAPLGAALAGSSGFIAAAERVRQRLGGGWRPASIPAAAALVAFDDWPERLTADHLRARRLAEGLQQIARVRIDIEQVQSNLVVAEVEGISAVELTAALRAADVLVLPYSDTLVRLALYGGIRDEDVDSVVAAFSKIVATVEAG